MSTSANASSASMAPPNIPATRLMYWSIQRELWENRSVYIVPLAVAGVTMFAFLIATIGRSMAAGDLARRRTILEEPYHFATALVMGAAFIVGIFYALEALHGERRDRSILFWKSLPVSDLTTVLAKLSIPVVFLPLFSFAIVLIMQFVMLLLSSIVMMGSGLDVASLWTHQGFFQMSLMLLYHLFTVHMLWYAPIYSWMLLVSGWAKRLAFLWAGLPIFAIWAIERISFGTSHFLNFMGYRLAGPDQFDFPTTGSAAMEQMSHLSLARFLATPGLWLGLIVAAGFILAAARQRRYRGPI